MSTTVGTIPAGILGNIASIVWEQLPRDLKSKLTVRVVQDAHQHRVKAIFFREEEGAFTGRWECMLEPGVIEGLTFNCRVPDTEIARLCVVVV